MAEQHRTSTWRRYALSVIDRLEQVCHVCGGSTFEPSGPWQRTVDHLVPLSLGGDLTPPIEALRIAHRACNTRRGNRGVRAPGARGPRPSSREEHQRAYRRARDPLEPVGEVIRVSSVPPALNLCLVCGKVIEPTGKAGRPRSTHPSCAMARGTAPLFAVPAPAPADELDELDGSDPALVADRTSSIASRSSRHAGDSNT